MRACPGDVDLSGLTIHAIGFGSESNLDGNMLSDLATTHGGRYLHAGGGLTLEKFFSDAFGNIFENGIIHDPEVDLPANQSGAKTPFRICGEDAMTVVAGWNRTDASLLLEVTSPGGAVITSATPAVESSSGRTWTFLRFNLPIGGERDGLWHVRVVRPGGGGEFPPPTPAMRYFINVIATGGPVMSRMPDSKRYYTGDTINPRVIVRYSNGGWPEEMNVSLTITRPDAGVGNILSAAGLKPPGLVDGDIIPHVRRHSNRSKPRPAIRLRTTWTRRSPSPTSPDSTGRSSRAGSSADRCPICSTVEGNYTFHAKAEYTQGCTGTARDPLVDPRRRRNRSGQDDGQHDAAGRRPGRRTLRADDLHPAGQVRQPARPRPVGRIQGRCAAWQHAVRPGPRSRQRQLSGRRLFRSRIPSIRLRSESSSRAGIRLWSRRRSSGFSSTA